MKGSHGYANGEQQRDFIYVDDVVAVNLWFLDHPEVSGVFNLGTGCARPFNAIAHALLSIHDMGALTYIPFPEHLKGAYQAYTCANISSLRKVGYDAAFTTVESGVALYYEWYQHIYGIISKVCV